MKKTNLKNKRVVSIIITVILLVTLAGCGASKKDSYSNQDIYNEAEYNYEGTSVEEEYYSEEESYSEMNEYSSNVNSDNSPGKTNLGTDGEIENIDIKNTNSRKLIKNASLSIETREFDIFIDLVDVKIKELGGYIEYSQIDGKSYSGTNYKFAEITLRIPDNKMDEYLDFISKNSNITSKNQSVIDVTLDYIDINSKKEALIVEQTRLYELVAQAESLEVIMILESRLTEIRYQVENIESQLRSYDNQTQYATLNLNISEVAKLSPAPEPIKELNLGEKIVEGMKDSFSNIKNNITDLIVNISVETPYIVLYLLIISTIILFFKYIIKKLKRKINKKEINKKLIDKLNKEKNKENNQIENINNNDINKEETHE